MDIISFKRQERTTGEVAYVHTYPKEKDNEDPRVDTVKGHQLKHVMHDDMLQKLDDLRIFLADLTEYQKYKKMETDPELLIPFQVTGFTISGADEHRGVVLIGQRMLAENRVVNLVAPFVKFDEETSHYDKSDDLFLAVMAACEEVKLYLNGKKRLSLQLELDLDGEQEPEPEPVEADSEDKVMLTVSSGNKSRKIKGDSIDKAFDDLDKAVNG